VITGSSVVDTPLDSTAAFSSIFTDKQVHHFRFQLSENGSNLDWALYIDGSVVLSGTVNSQACDGLVEVRLNAGDASNDIPVTFGHLVVWADGASAFDPPGIPALADMVLAASQYNNETAGRRIERLCSENDIVFSYDGDLDDTMPLGRQNEDNLLSAFHAAAEADGGMLIEPRNHLGLHYITKSALYNRAVDATLDYTSGVFSQVPIPVDDDAYTRNDVTVNGGSGGSARAIQETGPLSIEDPPDGVGRYDTSVQVNVGHESLLSNQASWRLSLGTIDEPRFPSVPIGMHHPSVSDDAALKASILGIDTGSRIQITNIPTWVSFNTLDLLALAVNERFNGFLWYLELVCAPFFPYLVGEYEAAEGETYRYDTAGSSLASSFESGVDTSMSVDIDILPLWTTDGDEVPFDIECGGVRLTVTAISGASSPQTFTITQTPVNGVEKVIPAGTAVSLWTKARYGL
jgi:hypothetical protein